MKRPNVFSGEVSKKQTTNGKVLFSYYHQWGMGHISQYNDFGDWQEQPRIDHLKMTTLLSGSSIWNESLVWERYFCQHLSPGQMQQNHNMLCHDG